MFTEYKHLQPNTLIINLLQGYHMKGTESGSFVAPILSPRT